MKWNKGAPPAIGWWPASNSRNPRAWRWWDGARWSACAFERYGAAEAAVNAAQTNLGRRDVEWRNWPMALRHLPGYPLSIPSQGTTPTTP